MDTTYLIFALFNLTKKDPFLREMPLHAPVNVGHLAEGEPGELGEHSSSGAVGLEPAWFLGLRF